jgi:hypothetical protein
VHGGGHRDQRPRRPLTAYTDTRPVTVPLVIVDRGTMFGKAAPEWDVLHVWAHKFLLLK